MIGLNKAGFVLHSTIHEFRPELNCVLHVHTPDVVAVRLLLILFISLSLCFYYRGLYFDLILDKIKLNLLVKNLGFNYILNIFTIFYNIKICPFLF